MKYDHLILPHRLWLAMREHVSAAAPLEACGLVAGHDNRAEVVYPIRNLLASPVRFRMEPYEQLQAFESIESAGLTLIGIYHSHPSGPETPSETDIQEARYEAAYLIWAPVRNEWQARAFWLDANSAAELRLVISEM